MNSPILKRIIWWLIICLMIIPLIQKKLHIFRSVPLFGVYHPASSPHIDVNNWFSGKYATFKERYINETMGFHESLVRLYDQVEFSVFKRSALPYIIVGKNNYLFEESYIRAHFGIDFIGEEKIKREIQMLKFIHDTLLSRNINLILIVAPNKASYCPENLPDNYKNKKVKTTNIQIFSQFANKLGLNYIDFNQYFIEHKLKTSYPLIPKYGSHWSQYGAFLAGDSLIKYIEELKNIDLPGLTSDEITSSTIPQFSDNDLERLMNLMNPLPPYELGYPAININGSEGSNKPSLLVVADSYYQNMLMDSIAINFTSSRYWYYHKTLYNTFPQNPIDPNNVSLREELMKSDVIILMATTPNLYNFGWGFIEDTYDMFKGATCTIDFNKSQWPGQVVKATGLSEPEDGWTWSYAKFVTIETVSCIPSRCVLKLRASTFGPNVNQVFTIRVGNETKEFRLSEFNKDITIPFRTSGDEYEIQIEIPHPTSPKNLGLGEDERMLGIALQRLSILPDNI